MDQPRLPTDVRHNIDRWIYRGELPDPFLSAVLKNDLYEAVLASTPDELQRLPALVHFLRDQAPEQSFGSRVNVAEWLASRGLSGRAEVMREARLL